MQPQLRLESLAVQLPVELGILALEAGLPQCPISLF